MLCYLLFYQKVEVVTTFSNYSLISPKFFPNFETPLIEEGEGVMTAEAKFGLILWINTSITSLSSCYSFVTYIQFIWQAK